MAESERIGPPEAGPAPWRRRRVVRALLYLCLVGAGVFAAWEVHVFWRGGEREAPDARPRTFGAGRPRIPTAPEPAEPGSELDDEGAPADGVSGADGEDISQLASDPLAAAGVESLPGDPGGLPPPEGAKRRSAFQQRTADSIHQQATYEWPGETPAAAHHYRELLARKGLDLLSDVDKGSVGRVIVARGGSKRVIVSLRKNKTASNRVRISVTMIDSGPP
jgi:hypothetical protein